MPTEMPFQVLSAETISEHAVLEGLRRTRLQGHGGVMPYEHASLALVDLDPSELVPAQRYVLTDGVQRALALRGALAHLGIDPFHLGGGVLMETSAAPGETIPLLPPIVEMSEEPDGSVVPLINDGIHRVFAARAAHEPIQVVLVTGVPPEYPYYALALPGGWDDVVQLDELPDGFEKKTYRQPDGYKALFRDFNGVFPGIQQARRQTNPGHLRA